MLRDQPYSCRAVGERKGESVMQMTHLYTQFDATFTCCFPSPCLGLRYFVRRSYEAFEEDEETYEEGKLECSILS
jgi:hypothetical protein